MKYFIQSEWWSPTLKLSFLRRCCQLWTVKFEQEMSTLSQTTRLNMMLSFTLWTLENIRVTVSNSILPLFVFADLAGIKLWIQESEDLKIIDECGLVKLQAKSLQERIYTPSCKIIVSLIISKCRYSFLSPIIALFASWNISYKAKDW